MGFAKAAEHPDVRAVSSFCIFLCFSEGIAGMGRWEEGRDGDVAWFCRVSFVFAVFVVFSNL